ncbi:MAG: lysophospholipase [Bacillota bacterium]|nr:lysophospholipase [Bacillota bacterium]
MEHRTGALPGARGAELFWQCWRPPGPRGVFLVVHGLGEHSGRYQNVVDALEGLPLSIWAHDLRGFGRSTGQRGHVDSFWDYMEDLDSFLELVRTEEGELPAFLLGHSFGGLVALHYALCRPGRLAGLVLSSPCVGLALEIPRWKRNAGMLLARFLPRFSMPNGIDPTLLSRDAEVVQRYRRDPLVTDRVSARLFAEMLSGMARVARRAVQLDAPCLLLLAGEDGLVSVPVAENVFVRLGTHDKEMHVYPGYFHELFNEEAKEEPLGRLRQWLEQRLDRARSR